MSPEIGRDSGVHDGNSSASSLSLYSAKHHYLRINSDLTLILHPLKRIPTMRLSGLQKDVLALYRSCLRESRKKPAVSCVPSTRYAFADVYKERQEAFRELCKVYNTLDFLKYQLNIC